MVAAWRCGWFFIVAVRVGNSDVDLWASNTLLFFIYTWPFFLALMPVAVVVGIALHSLMDGKLRYSIVFTLATVGIMFGALFMWLLG